MAFDGIDHVALFVRGLRDAERLYVDLFGMEVAFREGMTDGEFRQLPADESWDDLADRAEILMSFCTRNEVTVALHEPDAERPVEGPIDHLNVSVPADERSRICDRAPEFGCEVDAVPYENDHRYVTTPAGVTWELATEG